jgi:polyphosphate glucokinase
MHGDLERIEYVLTLGTGFGFALFRDGNIAPHLELSQHPIRKHKTYNEYVGEAALECAGGRHWSKRVHKIIAIIDDLPPILWTPDYAAWRSACSGVI